MKPHTKKSSSAENVVEESSAEEWYCFLFQEFVIEDFMQKVGT
jgi:hypothetical protein